MKKLLSLPPNLVNCFHDITGLPADEFFCTCDPIGHRLGSGGGTVWLLQQAYLSEEFFDERSGQAERRVKSEESAATIPPAENEESATTIPSANGTAAANSTLYTLNSTLKDSSLYTKRFFTLHFSLFTSCRNSTFLLWYSFLKSAAQGSSGEGPKYSSL